MSLAGHPPVVTVLVVLRIADIEYEVTRMERRIEPEAVAAILQQLLPCLDPEKVINTFGERTVIYSDDTQSPALYVEIMLLENTPKYIHLLASVFSSITDKRGCSEVIIERQL